MNIDSKNWKTSVLITGTVVTLIFGSNYLIDRPTSVAEIPANRTGDMVEELQDSVDLDKQRDDDAADDLRNAENDRKNGNHEPRHPLPKLPFPWK
ncbi:hypothetical protein C3B59_17350 [Cryobacterium zongtaii]|uniref:Uncharacterized protein n=1 Tax=Cryobacterium zongtaii TaxID=1259217 RepID=A0A2S3Z5Y2_9MICO|nr:hypothetical protein [Cryobacterium zongtaii]POH59658.1 hypothetical protein C3B59_17350 [Cryobacterium zongtaii]